MFVEGAGGYGSFGRELIAWLEINTSENGCHAELVEAWRVGLCARGFDELRLTGLFFL